MTVSIVIPTFNRARMVDAAIQSALRHGGDAEVIVVDDGSTDDTSQLLAGFGAAIVAIRQPNGGVSRARNAGVRAARSAYVKFLDSDDLLPEGALTALRGGARDAAPREIVLGDADCLYDDGRIVPGASLGYGYAAHASGPLGLLGLLSGGMQTELPLFQRAALLAVGGFDEALFLGEDKELALRLWRHGWRFSRLPAVVAHIRVHGGARLSSGKDAAVLANLIVYFRRMRGLLDAMPESSDAARTALARDMWSEARCAARAGCGPEADALFGMALDLGGRSAAVGDRAVRALYRVTTPRRAERLAMAAKRLIGR